MDHLVLRSFCDEDFIVFQKWISQDYVAKWYEHPEAWFEELKDRENKFWFIHHMIATDHGKEIGFCQYYEYQYGGEDWHNEIEMEGTYSIDYMIGEVEYLGRGFGREIIKALTELIFTLPNAVRIIVKPEDENIASVKALLSAGYEYDPKNELYIMNK